MSKKTIWTLVAAAVVVVVAGGVVLATSGKKSSSSKEMNMSGQKMSMSSSMDMSMANMDSSLPTDLPNASQPKYAVGSKITVLATHMANMKGAKGTVAAAYDVKLYQVDYQPTNGGKKVTGHKWLTRDEFSDKQDHQKGDMVTLTGDHMAGMKGAMATITKVENGPAYAINFEPTNGGKMVMNHKYLIESEIKAR